MAVVPLALSLIDYLPDPIEDRLQQELRLVDVEVRAVRAPGFATASFEERIALIRERDLPSPVVWLLLDDDEVQVSIATVSADRANVRLVAVPRNSDAAADLAVGVREIVAQLAPPPPASDEPERFVAKPRIGAGLSVPLTRLAGGPRALVQAEALWIRGRSGLGGLAAFQIGDGQWRVGVGPTLRFGPAVAAARLDVARLPWVTWVQPRLELGATWLRRRLWVESRLGWVPVRDLVEDEGEPIYDSGRIEWTFLIGLRQIRNP